MFYQHLQSLKESVLSQQDKPSESKQSDLFFSTVLNNNHQPQSNMSMLINLQKTNQFLQQQNKNNLLENKRLTQQLKLKQNQCANLNETIMKIRLEENKQKTKFFQLNNNDNGKIFEEMLTTQQQMKQKIVNLQLEIQRNNDEKQMLKEIYMEARDNMLQEVSVLKIQNTKKDRFTEQLKLQLKQKDEQLAKKYQQIQTLKIYHQKEVKEHKHSYTGSVPSSSFIQNSKKNVGSSSITSSSDKNTSKRKLSFDMQVNTVVNHQKLQLQKIEEQSNSQNVISKLMDGFTYSKDYYKFALAQQKYKLAKLQKQHQNLLEQCQGLLERNRQLQKMVKRYQQKISILVGKQETYDALFDKQQKKIGDLIKTYDEELEKFRIIQNQQLSKKWLDQYHILQEKVQDKQQQIAKMEKTYEEEVTQLKKKIRQLQRQQKLIIRQSQSPRNIEKINIPIEIKKKFDQFAASRNSSSNYNVKQSPEYVGLQKQLLRYKNLFKNEKLNHQKVKNYHEALLKVLEKAKKLGRKDSNEIVDDAINWVKRTSSQLSGEHQNKNTLYCRGNVISRVQQNPEIDSRSLINPETPILHLQTSKNKNPFQNVFPNSKKQQCNQSIVMKI